jgi:hypothetical protein
LVEGVGIKRMMMVETYKPGAAEKTMFKKGSETSRLRYTELSIKTKKSAGAQRSAGLILLGHNANSPKFEVAF